MTTLGIRFGTVMKRRGARGSASNRVMYLAPVAKAWGDQFVGVRLDTTDPRRFSIGATANFPISGWTIEETP